jgi:hypothetical protein
MNVTMKLLHQQKLTIHAIIMCTTRHYTEYMRIMRTII